MISNPHDSYLTWSDFFFSFSIIFHLSTFHFFSFIFWLFSCPLAWTGPTTSNSCFQEFDFAYEVKLPHFFLSYRLFTLFLFSLDSGRTCGEFFTSSFSTFFSIILTPCPLAFWPGLITGLLILTQGFEFLLWNFSLIFLISLSLYFFLLNSHGFFFNFDSGSTWDEFLISLFSLTPSSTFFLFFSVISTTDWQLGPISILNSQ